MVYLIRHAQAGDAAGGPDAVRRLTDHGREQAADAGRALRSKKVVLARILTSPLMRARETAELIARELDPPPPVEVREGLRSGAPPEQIRAEIDAAEEIALVGHQPDLGMFVAATLGEAVAFSTSSICCLQLGGSPRILWFLHP